MAGPMTWELAEDAAKELGCVAVLTGHPDTLAKGNTQTVQLHRATTYKRGGFAQRALSWVQYVVQAFFWLWRWSRDTPLLFFSNPPILCWLGWMMKNLHRRRYAVMVHDIYPDVLVRLNGISDHHPVIRLWRWLNRRAYQNASVVMTMGEHMTANLEKQFDSRRTPAGRVEVVYPWVDTSRIKPVSKEENWFARKYGQQGKLTVMYSGNMGLGHDIETILEAARHLREDHSVHFMLIGAGAKWELAKDVLAVEDLENVTLLPWQPENSIPYSLATAEIGIVSMENGLAGLAIPSKSVYAMAAGSAILLLATGPTELHTWLEKHECGISLEPGDAEGIVCFLREMVANPERLHVYQRNSRQLAEQLLSRSVNVRGMLQSVRLH